MHVCISHIFCLDAVELLVHCGHHIKGAEEFGEALPEDVFRSVRYRRKVVCHDILRGGTSKVTAVFSSSVAPPKRPAQRPPSPLK